MFLVIVRVFSQRKMHEECDPKDWLVELNVRPNEMKGVDPPSLTKTDDYHRLLNSIYSMTLAENYVSHQIDSYILEHIQLEQDCFQQNQLNLIWSDDVSLTFVFLASLAHHGEYSQNDLLEKYFKWWMHG